MQGPGGFVNYLVQRSRSVRVSDPRWNSVASFVSFALLGWFGILPDPPDSNRPSRLPRTVELPSRHGHNGRIDFDRAICMSPIHSQVSSADQIQCVSKLSALPNSTPFARRLHVCCERTRRLEHPQAAHAAMINPFMGASVEMLLDHFDGRIRTVPVRFDHEFESAGMEGGLTGISKMGIGSDLSSGLA